MLATRVLAALPPELPAAVVRDGAETLVACGAEEVVRADGTAGLAALDGLGTGFWVGFLAYDLGRSVERVAPRVGAGRRPVPDVLFARFAARVALGGAGPVRTVGTGEARRVLDAAVRSAVSAAAEADAGARAPASPSPPALSGWQSSLDRDAYEAGVRTIVELIRAGECYQANLTRILTTPATADPVALWAAVAAGNPAPHSSFLRLDGVHVVSASPERFLRVEGRRVETRPIKGTAPDAATLRASAKDRAENVMIVDLARNDLGRVCTPGSIEAPAVCALEEHPGLVHLVSTVTGSLRPGATRTELVRATFPPASVTGAPKPRVLQVIEDLEPVSRGVYCGAVGWIDTERDRAELAVAIRTFVATPAGSAFGVGSGITVDSDPAGEWAETNLKARRLLALAGAGRHGRTPVGARVG